MHTEATWNMAKKLKITENEKYTLLGRKYGEEKLKKVENLEMSTVGRKYGKKTENHGK